MAVCLKILLQRISKAGLQKGNTIKSNIPLHYWFLEIVAVAEKRN